MRRKKETCKTMLGRHRDQGNQEIPGTPKIQVVLISFYFPRNVCWVDRSPVSTTTKTPETCCNRRAARLRIERIGLQHATTGHSVLICTVRITQNRIDCRCNPTWVVLSRRPSIEYCGDGPKRAETHPLFAPVKKPPIFTRLFKKSYVLRDT